jgi:putative membrane protein
MLSEAECKEIEKAVAAVEEKTTGEIVCILAESVSHYPEIPLAWAAGLAFILPPLLVWLGLDAGALVDWAGGWSASAGPASAVRVMSAVAGYALLQAVIFLFVLALLSVHALRVFLTPKALKKARVHRAAFAQYLATGLHQSGARTGVVIFASFEDRCVSIVADPLIHQAVGAEIWDRAVAAVEDGMRVKAGGAGLVQAIRICGDALAAHFPGKSADELSNKPLTIGPAGA